ncbi:MAG: fatty acid desaturase [Pseudomonadota bacterium]
MATVALSVDNIDQLSDSQLDLLERQIAGKFMRVVPWSAVVWGLLNCVLFFALFPLVLFDAISEWVAFPIATLCIMLAYLPSHEAQHNIIAARGAPLRWLNELVGHVSPLPLAFSYRALRATHMQHHAHTNDPELDPDYDIHEAPERGYFLTYLKQLQPSSKRNDAYGVCLQRIGQPELIFEQALFEIAYLLVLFTMAWTGYAIEAALLWWLPRMIGLYHTFYYLAREPHTPAEKQGRYADTRAFRSRFGNVVSAGMQYHIVHHLYPKIPLRLTPQAYRELRPLLVRRGCDLGDL